MTAQDGKAGKMHGAGQREHHTERSGKRLAVRILGVNLGNKLLFWDIICIIEGRAWGTNSHQISTSDLKWIELRRLHRRPSSICKQ